MDRQQRLAARIGDGDMQPDLRLRGADPDQLAGTDLPGGHRVEVHVEGDQTVLADVPQMPLGDYVRSLRQRAENGVITYGSVPGDFAVGAVDLRSPQGNPGSERRCRGS